jgi:hypothetical protein
LHGGFLFERVRRIVQARWALSGILPEHSVQSFRLDNTEKNKAARAKRGLLVYQSGIQQDCCFIPQKQIPPRCSDREAIAG